MKEGLLVVISGFSGAGKGTLMKELFRVYKENYALSISATTRAPREGEQHGREYFFVSKEQFEEMIAREELIEYANYVGNYYGSPVSYIEEQRKSGKDVILEIEVQGAIEVKRKFPDTTLIFVTPPSKEELRRRLLGRGTESMEQIENRLLRAKEEALSMEEYDFIIINDEVDAATKRLHHLIQSQHFRLSHNKDLVNEIQDDMCGKGLDDTDATN